jgi:hypothetical protein
LDKAVTNVLGIARCPALLARGGGHKPMIRLTLLALVFSTSTLAQVPQRPMIATTTVDGES